MAQGDPDDAPEDMEVELEDEEDAEEEDGGLRTPPPPASRFRKASKRFGGGGSKRSSKRGGRSSGGSGTDRLGKTEGKVKFELADPPKYYKRKNRPYLMPKSNQ